MSTSQSFIDGYATPLRRDRKKSVGSILVYVKEDIPCKLKVYFLKGILEKQKLLLFARYHPPNDR